MKIADLPYLEYISGNETNETLGGNAVLDITADASATGNNSFAWTDTNVLLKTNGKKNRAKGKGTALAIGEDPYTNVDVYHAGFDRVRIKTKNKERKNYSLTVVKVKAK